MYEDRLIWRSAIETASDCARFGVVFWHCLQEAVAQTEQLLCFLFHFAEKVCMAHPKVILSHDCGCKNFD